jgi:hypothetical protein
VNPATVFPLQSNSANKYLSAEPHFETGSSQLLDEIKYLKLGLEFPPSLGGKFGTQMEYFSLKVLPSGQQASLTQPFKRDSKRFAEVEEEDEDESVFFPGSPKLMVV